jgi:hypothetical protein
VVAKRGWRAVARVRFRWENGVKGTEAFFSLDEAESCVAKLRRRSEQNGMDVEIELERIEPK